ncbi:MAG: DUF1501 domain-containing protein [Phycisphaeraceae bacterium]|nr:DUF1501 domain-containing protein [Phycisphaeraceae bacterium]MCB9847956.1 DUF1501 domain-containing protein [Phycisphaeraceae bacterium]
MSIDLHNATTFTRRRFLTTGVTLASCAVTVPWFVQGSARALAQSSKGLSSVPGRPDERVLVVLQLGGGNDGLNTVAPVDLSAYHNARPSIGLSASEALRLDPRHPIGLHPGLTGLKSLYDEGLLSVIQGVGYPNPNRSHFKSMDIWHTADLSGVGQGWLGRYFDNQCRGEPSPDPAMGLALGRKTPLAMEGREVRPLSFETSELYRRTASDGGALDSAYDEAILPGADLDPGSPAAYLMRTAMDAQLSGALIRGAVDRTPTTEFPRTALGRQLAMVAGMIGAGMTTKVYYVTMSGFDTHAGQGGVQGSHANLLTQFGDAMRAFYAELRAQRNDTRVLTMCFSEFGRRVKQNGSNGTDHGTAAPMFLAGPMARAGVLNEHPSLTDLDDNGDLKFTIDFRSVYAGILEDWLKADAFETLGVRMRPARVIAAE